MWDARQKKMATFILELVSLDQKVAPFKLLTISYWMQYLRLLKSKKFVITLIIDVHNY